MKYFLILLFAVLTVSIIPVVFGMPYFSEQEKFNASHVVLTGEIISIKHPEPPPNMLSSLDVIYEIKVDKYLKNPMDTDIVSVIARGGPGADVRPRSSNVDFDVGELVYLFLREDENAQMLRLNPFASYRIDVPCEPISDELAHLTDVPSQWEFQITDSQLDEKQFFGVNEEIIIRYDATNLRPTTQTLTYDITIHDGENKENRQIFHTESKEITLPGCIGHAILEWIFIPTKADEYFIDVRNDGRGTGIGISVTEDGSAPSNYYDQPIVEYPVLKQHKMKIEDGNLMCKRDNAVLAFRDNGKPACFMPSTLAKLLDRGYIGKKSYIPTPDLNLTGQPHPSGIALDAAAGFIHSTITFTFDGSEKNGGVSNLTHKLDSPPTYLLNGRFYTDTTGYGDRSNQHVSETKTYHNMIMKVKGSDVIYAVIDNQWDELNQEFIAQRSESFKDFELRFQTFFGKEAKDYHIKLESRPGLMRITETPNDTFYLVNHSEFEKFWNVVIENEFFDISQNVEHCNTCTTNVLKIESGGTHNTVSWYVDSPIGPSLFDILTALDNFSQNKSDSWPQP